MTEVVSAILDCRYPPQECSLENALKEHWYSSGLLGETLPTAIAMRGGALADRLSWVFVAGYQATLRQVFPELPHARWGSFLVTENRGDPQNFPPTFLSDDSPARLSGTKTWVAASASVDTLVVKAGQGADSRYVWVSRDAPGVELPTPPRANFLPDLTQGIARFDNVEVPAKQFLDSQRARTFGRWEPLFVQMAGAAMMLSHCLVITTASQLIDRLSLWLLAAERLAVKNTRDKDFATIGALLDREIGALTHAFSDTLTSKYPASVEHWSNDRKLLSMYSKGIQARAND